MACEEEGRRSGREAHGTAYNDGNTFKTQPPRAPSTDYREKNNFFSMEQKHETPFASVVVVNLHANLMQLG